MNAVAESSGLVTTDTGPFTIIPEWVLDAEVGSPAVRLYGVLGRYTDATGACWPSRKTLARRLRMSTDTVDRALKELQAIEAVDVEKQYDDNGDRAPNKYQVNRCIPEMRRGGRVGAATGGRTSDEGGSRASAAQNDSQLEREPVEREHSLEERPQDKLFLRLVKVCTGSRVAVFPEATKVLEILRQHFSDHIIDEGIGVCELLSTPPILPRYLLNVLQERAKETGTYVPDLSAEFKGEAA